MQFNTIHKEYRLGMGLFFKLVFNHAEHPGRWMCKSNIPDLDCKKLESDNQADAVYEVMGIINSELQLEYTDEIVQASVPKDFPPVEFENGVPKFFKTNK